MSLIVADSGCDLRTQEVRVPFARVPLRIVVGGTEYEDKESRTKNFFWGIVLVALIVGIYFYFN